MDMDLEKFFDTVCQSKLIEVLSKTIKDGRVISLIHCKGKCRFRVSPKSVEKMKDRIRKLTKRSNGWGNEYRAMKLTQFVRGWVNYFSLADMKGLLRETDEWLRHKIRTIYWKQWKKVKTKFKELKKFRCGRRKGMDMCQHEEWKLVL